MSHELAFKTPTEEDITLKLNRLIETGLDEGTLAIGQIIETFPQIKEDEEQAEAVFEALEEAGVTLISEGHTQTPPEEESYGEEPSEEELEELIADSFLDETDLEGMYFREQGKIALLPKGEGAQFVPAP